MPKELVECILQLPYAADTGPGKARQLRRVLVGVPGTIGSWQ